VAEETKRSGNVKTIPLPNGQVTLVDDEDFDSLSLFNWYISSKGYVRRNKNAGSRVGRTTINMARQILNAPETHQVDHINNDKLDNRKDNLRLVGNSENSQNKIQSNNSTGYKGVSVHKATGRFVAQIGYNSKRHHLGLFDNAEDAARAYDKVATEFFGSNALLNFPKNNRNKYLESPTITSLCK
jgi:hypothetical protein